MMIDIFCEFKDRMINSHLKNRPVESFVVTDGMNRFCWLSLALLLLCVSTCKAELKQKEIQEAYHSSYRYEKMGNYSDAIKALRLVYNHYKQGYTVNLRLGHLYTQSGLYANALEHYQKAIQTSKSSMTAKLGKMLVYIYQGQYEKSEELGYEILNTDYYNYYGNLRLAYTLRMRKNLELGEKVCLKMLGLYPSDVLFLVEYGIIKFLQCEYVAAMGVFSDVLILDPENVTAKEYTLAIKNL
jgi:tetratricopeptide (TPR) repeat protein